LSDTPSRLPKNVNPHSWRHAAPPFPFWTCTAGAPHPGCCLLIVPPPPGHLRSWSTQDLLYGESNQVRAAEGVKEKFGSRRKESRSRGLSLLSETLLSYPFHSVGCKCGHLRKTPSIVLPCYLSTRCPLILPRFLFLFTLQVNPTHPPKIACAPHIPPFPPLLDFPNNFFPNQSPTPNLADISSPRDLF